MKVFFALLALVLASCTTPPAPVATTPPVDNRNCATIAKELEQVNADMEQLEPAATKAAADNKNIRESFMSKILIFQYLRYDAGTPARYRELKKRRNELELILTEKDCQAVQN